MRALAREHRPKMIIAGYSAYSRVIDWQAFADVAREVGAVFLVDMAHFAGLAAAGVYPSPVPYADVVTSTTHKTLRGPRGGIILCKAEHAKAVDKAMFPGMQGGPLEHVIAAKAVAFHEALQPSFTAYCRQVVENARVLAADLAARGYHIVSGGTDNHLMLVDLRSKGLTGKVAEAVLDRAGITVNKNTVPRETQSPFVTSGIRIGTPAVTTRGMDPAAMHEVAACIDRVLSAPGDEAVVAAVREDVRALAGRFPLYSGGIGGPAAGRAARHRGGCGTMRAPPVLTMGGGEWVVPRVNGARRQGWRPGGTPGGASCGRVGVPRRDHGPDPPARAAVRGAWLPVRAGRPGTCAGPPRRAPAHQRAGAGAGLPRPRVAAVWRDGAPRAGALGHSRHRRYR
jgi:hypothetical protein